MKKLYLSIALALACAPAAWAGGTAVIQAADSGDSIRLEYEGGKVRLNGGPGVAANGYMLVDEGSVYVVSLEEGQPKVMDMAVMGKMMGTMAGLGGQQLSINDLIGEVTELQPLNRTEEVAGISGQLYRLEYQTAQGQVRSDELVLSSDPRALEFTRALLQLERSMAQMVGQPSAQDALVERLQLGVKQGVLRFGSDMRLVSLSDTSPDASRFQLPAQPSLMPDFGSLLKQVQDSPEVMDAMGEAMKALQELQGR